MRIVHIASRALGYFENIAVIMAGVMVIAMMLLTTFDVMMRYVFGSPLSFQIFLTSRYLLVGAILLGLSWSFRTGGYIRITLLTAALPAMWRNIMLRAGLLISSVYIALLAWRGGQHFLYAARRGLIFVEDHNWPVAWSWVWIPIGCTLLALRVFLTAIGPAEELSIEHSPTEET